MLDNPFAFINRVLAATAKIIMYTAVFIVQAACYTAMLKKDKIVDAFGYLGRGTTDAVTEIFRDK